MTISGCFTRTIQSVLTGLTAKNVQRLSLKSRTVDEQENGNKENKASKTLRNDGKRKKTKRCILIDMNTTVHDNMCTMVF